MSHVDIKKKSIEVALVILHYRLDKETKKCIENFIEKIDTESYEIVVVDNYSNNGSIEKLQKEFSDYTKIHFVLNESNLGFSAGNNRGISFVREHFDADFIIVSNNDVYLDCNNLTKTLFTEYNHSKFAVAGPFITNVNKDDHVNVNPYKYELPEPDLYNGEDKCLIELRKIKNKKLYNFLKIKYHEIRYLYRKILIVPKRKIINKNIEIVKKYNQRSYEENMCIYNVILHGCWLVFSNEFFKFYKGFDERLFLYGEEVLLFYHLSQKNLTSVYIPHLKIIHNHAASTKTVDDSEKFFIDNYNKSQSILNKYIYLERY